MIQLTPILATYLSKTVLVSKLLFTKKGLTLTIPILAFIQILPNTIFAGILLLFLMILDFVTGLMVSRKTKKEAEKLKPELKNEYLISSTGLKRSGIKFLLYGSTIVIAWAIQNILELRSFNFQFTDLRITVTLIVVLWWIIVEIYSIVFENFKKLGIDVFEIFNKIISLIKKGKAKIAG